MSAPIFGPEGRAALEHFLAAPTLLAFDYDGTLAPIRRDRNGAQMRGRTHSLLSLVSRAYPCAVISGRSEPDLRRRLQGVPLVGLVGNHGIEPEGTRRAYPDLVRRWLTGLRSELEGVEGVDLEDKRFSLSIHYRNAPHVQSAARQISRVARRLADARLIPGKRVVNVVPLGAPNKADAVARMARRIRCTGAIFLGDDATDEDVFSMRSLPVLGIRVGRSTRSAAPFHLRSQTEIDDFLEYLLAPRSSLASSSS
ncbi:MAG: trehalose-phosphatase [Deltaproteobacteria bacterium]|nr:trehalose-phosphatase [Deltaproteobacteria bacterium]